MEKTEWRRQKSECRMEKEEWGTKKCRKENTERRMQKGECRGLL